MRDIDWNSLWQESRKQRTCKAKGSTDWDKKAPSFARRNRRASYVDRFVELIGPEAADTILDVGCGPGTLALPLAKQARQVTALDYSAGMLAELQREATAANIGNIKTMQLAWEDDWQGAGVVPHDIVVASRSLSVDDLAAALRKLNDFSLKKVYISDRVGTGPFDPEVFMAIGRPFDPGPDFIYTFNILHQMGIHARVDYIDAEYQGVYETREEAVDSCLWMLEDLTPEEEEKFNRFIGEKIQRLPDGRWQYKRRRIPKWAIIWWEKE